MDYNPNERQYRLYLQEISAEIDICLFLIQYDSELAIMCWKSNIISRARICMQ